MAILRSYDKPRLAVPLPGRPVAELACVGGATLLVLVLVTSPHVSGALPAKPLHFALLLAIAAGAGIAALFAGHCARLTRDPRVAAQMSVLTAALGAYTLVVFPLTIARPGAGPSWEAARTVAFACFALLLAGLALRCPWKGGLRWTGLALAVAATVSTWLLATTVPLVAGFFATPAPAIAVLGCWLLLALVLLVQGARGDDRLRWRIGMGLAAIAGVHLARGLTVHEEAVHVTVPALRLLAVLVLAAAVLAATGSAVRDLRERQRQEAARARVSAAELRRHERRQAERDHEMRNLVSGLACVSHVLATGSTATDNAELVRALRHELDRLRRLLDEPSSTTATTDVGELLTRQVLLRRAGGEPIELDLAPGLRAAVPAAELAQVVTNLLANCRRHAPGAPVRVSARPCAGRVLLEVHDGGAGAPVIAREVFPRGQHDPRAGGQGLGLHLSAALLDRHGARLRLGPSPALRGAVAMVDLPAAA